MELRKKVMKETAQKGESWEAVGVTSFGEAWYFWILTISR